MERRARVSGAAIRSFYTAAAVATTLLASGCSSNAPLDDNEMIVRATLQALTADGRALCVDSRTRGQPLAVFRTMMLAPVPSRRPLAWHVPTPLQPPQGLSDRQLYDDQIRGVRVYLDRQPAGGGRLKMDTQSRLDTAALNLSISGFGEPVTVSRTWSSPRVVSRWWVLNRLSGNCAPNYVMSNPVSRGQLGFITVSANHWGRTFALRKLGNDWQVAAEWTGWLY